MSKKALSPASQARKSLVIVKDIKGDYAPSIAASVNGGLSALHASVAEIAALKVGGKLTDHLQKVCENSIILGAVMAGLAKRGFTGDLLAEALRLRSLKGWTKDCKGSDDYRTQGDEQLFTAARAAKKYYLDRLELKTVSTQGGKRANAGAKRKEESASKVEPTQNAPKTETAVLKPAVADDFKLKTPAKTPKDAAHYLYNLEKGLRMTMEANKPAFKDELLADVTANILKQIERLHSKLD